MRLMHLRTALLVLPFALTGHATAESPPRPSPGEPQTVLFVCEHGSVKSLVAAEHFNRRAQERGLSYRAVARGTAPDRAVPASVLQGLHADGFDVSRYVPRQLQPSDVDGVKAVISFDQDVATTIGGRAPYLKWDGLPGVLANYASGRDAIVKKVDALVESLAVGGKP